jgi:tRNA(Ile)-lysidine synthase
MKRFHPFAAAVLATCRRRKLLGADDRPLVALSGGPDSTALLAALAALRDGGLLGALAAVHVDHRLRPASAADAAPCRALCRRMAVLFESVEVTVAAGNLQAEARRARYAALRSAAARLGATRIATGHTRTDQAETVLLRLLRGSGARGLSGIPPRRGNVVRPLIDRSRAEVLSYLRDLGLPWLEDPTNATPRFQRNRVRAEVIPLLEALNPSLERALARTADLLRDDERALDRLSRAAARGAVAEGEVLLAAPVAVRRRAVRRLWRAASGRRAGLAHGHVEAVLALLRRRGPGRSALPGGLEARFAYGRLELGRRSRSGAVRAEEIAIPAPGRYALPGRGGAVEIALAAGARMEQVDWPLVLRTRRPGDRFGPEGGRGSKKLKAWLIDRKVPREERDGLLVLADRRGRVLWLPDLEVRGRAPLELRLV